MRRLTGIEWGLIVAAALFLLYVLVPIVFGTTERRLSAVCKRCGVSQYDVYRVVRVFGIAWSLPNGIAATGSGHGDCPHEMEFVRR